VREVLAMRIGVTLESLKLRWGGIRVYTEEIVKHLLKLDQENEYILMYPSFGVPHQLLGKYHQEHKNVTEVETDFSWTRSGLYWDQIIVPNIAKRYSIDILFNPFLSVPIFGSFKKIMIIHAVEYHTVPNVYNWKLYARWCFLEKILLPSADRVISISNMMTNDLSRTVKYPIENIRTIYHGVSEKFQIIKNMDTLQEAREKYQLPEPFILFVGHIYPQKNFANLVKAFHLITQEIPHELVVVGSPRWKYEDDLRLVDTLNLSGRIHFRHHVPNDDLPAIYNLASCLVFPSLYEAFGLVQLEAMACGCPVIAARAGAIPEISGGAALLFDPHNPGDLAEGILQTINNADFRQSLIRRGLTRAKEFTWDRCAAETLEVFKEVVAG
jgi:glycosyltransferase involved in cell wall biosynthesis